MTVEEGLVSIVIINFNSRAYLEKCVAAIERQTWPSREILVINNGSTDGSVTMMKDMEASGRIRAFHGENIGASKANNLGIREARGEFVLVLNADAFPEADYLEKTIQVFRRYPEVGSVTGKLISDADASIIDSAGVYFYREGVAIDRGFGQRDRGQFDREEPVDGVCCAAGVYRRSMLEDIRVDGEFFDEDFFAFVEDSDLSFRAGLKGWTTLYLPSAIARHVRGGSSGKLREFTYFLNERNTRLFLRKTFRLVARPSDRFLQGVLLAGRWLTLRRNLSRAMRKRLAQEMAALGRSMDAKRGQLLSQGKSPNFSMLGRKSYVWERLLRWLGAD